MCTTEMPYDDHESRWTRTAEHDDGATCTSSHGPTPHHIENIGADDWHFLIFIRTSRSRRHRLPRLGGWAYSREVLAADVQITAHRRTSAAVPVHAADPLIVKRLKSGLKPHAVGGVTRRVKPPAGVGSVFGALAAHDAASSSPKEPDCASTPGARAVEGPTAW